MGLHAAEYGDGERMNTGHLPRVDYLPEPEHPYIPRVRPSRREYIAALLWETCAAVDGWLRWVGFWLQGFPVRKKMQVY